MNDYQLRRWLMREIHGIEIPRKPPKKSSTLTGKPARNWKYRQWIRSLPCLICGIEPAGEAAHTGSDGGMAQKASDWSCIPLCHECHTQAPDAYHRLGKLAFEHAHNVKLLDWVKRLNRLWFHPQRNNVNI